MRKFFVCLGLGVFTASVNGLSFYANAALPEQHCLSSSCGAAFSIAQADQSALIKENRELLITNRALARKIATKLGIASTGEVPTSGTPLEQNQVLILQNQETFKAIANKVGATVPALSPVDGADQAEKNHKLLLQNKSIIVEVLKKLELPVATVELTGTFVEKNHTLLVGNGKALAKIATKLGVS
jgi:hypothetical protein